MLGYFGEEKYNKNKIFLMLLYAVKFYWESLQDWHFLNFTTLWANSATDKLIIFSRK